MIISSIFGLKDPDLGQTPDRAVRDCNGAAKYWTRLISAWNAPHNIGGRVGVCKYTAKKLLRRWFLLYRVFFSKGPTQKSSKYGIGPNQQDKMAKYTGPTQSYQRSKE